MILQISLSKITSLVLLRINHEWRPLLLTTVVLNNRYDYIILRPSLWETHKSSWWVFVWVHEFKIHIIFGLFRWFSAQKVQIIDFLGWRIFIYFLSLFLISRNFEVMVLPFFVLFSRNFIIVKLRVVLSLIVRILVHFLIKLIQFLAHKVFWDNTTIHAIKLAVLKSKLLKFYSLFT